MPVSLPSLGELVGGRSGLWERFPHLPAFHDGPEPKGPEAPAFSLSYTPRVVSGRTHPQSAVWW